MVHNYKKKKSFFSSLPEHPSPFFMFYYNVLRKDPYTILVKDIMDKDGKVSPYTYAGPSIAGLNTVLVNDVKSIKQALIEHQDFAKLPEFYDIVRILLGEGLVTATGELWRKDRQVLTPLFNVEHLRKYYPTMNKLANLLVEELKNREEHHHVDTKLIFGNHGMKVLVKCMFGDCFDETYQDEIATVSKSVLDSFPQAVLGTKLFSANIFAKIFPPIRRLTNMRQTVKHKMQELKKNKLEGDDLLSRMISSKYDNGESIEDEQIISEAMTMFLAGHETTSTNLIYLCYLLVKYPHVQEKLRNELFSVLGDSDPTPETLDKLKYLQNVVKESLRLYMALPVILRYAKKDMIFEHTGQVIPKGTALALNVLRIHYDPELYPNPTEFIPERYESGEEEGGNAYNYLPFSGGARICIGRKFAMQEVEITLSILLRKIRLTKVHPEELQHVYSGTMHPKEFMLDYEVL